MFEIEFGKREKDGGGFTMLWGCNMRMLIVESGKNVKCERII